MNIVKKSYAKVNIFLKIVGVRDNYHLLASRFVRVHNLYDTINFIASPQEDFVLEGDFGCETKKNTIYKAYLALKLLSSTVEEYFKNYKVVVEKNIPEFAGLGGGSSNCATFMLMVNEVCELRLSKDELCDISVTIGADVPFFIYEYDSANVSGIGEIVEKFDEEVLNINTFTPKIMCDTGAIFRTFREKFYKEISKKEQEKLFAMKSKDIYDNYDMNNANDLYASALYLKKDLNTKTLKLNPKSFFSGSGSSFFTIN